jgi:BirA family biotin operon repressor/biotin-[acetyl-CoA-carboxylase] ligase
LPEPSPTKPIGTPFIEMQSVDSTNNYALSQVHAGSLPDRQSLVQHGTTFFAHEQVAGKGQRGKAWATEKGANIILSIVIKPAPLLLTQQFQLSATVAVAVHKFFSRYAGTDTKIKWPNDLYWQDRKAGGILIESVVGNDEPANWKWAVAGIGININQTSFPAELQNPVSLKQITGHDFDTVILAKELCSILEEKYCELINEGFTAIYAEYLLHLYKKNELVKLKKENRVFEAIIKTVLPTGRLVVEHSIEEDPIAIGFNFGEAEWVIK